MWTMDTISNGQPRNTHSLAQVTHLGRIIVGCLSCKTLLTDFTTTLATYIAAYYELDEIQTNIDPLAHAWEKNLSQLVFYC